MATFKVGQRVRLVSTDTPSNACYIGCTGTVSDSRVREWDGKPHIVVDWDDGEMGYYEQPRCLAPLTPPAADAWAADAVRKVTRPQHVEPVAPVVIDEWSLFVTKIAKSEGK